jgi:DNA-binding MarR family transcriptional regulator
LTDLFLTDRDDRIWFLRHQCKWTVPRIARHMNLGVRTVQKHLRRMSRARGIVRKRHPLKQRNIRIVSLSQIFNV